MKMIVMMLGLVLSAMLAVAEPIGMVVAVEGEASATDSTGAVRTLAMKSDIMLNDTLKTGAKARVQIMLLDDSLVSIGASSEMTIDEYVYNPSTASDNAFGAKLGKGVFRTVTGKITDLNPERFNVKTRRATIGIRGCDLGFDTTREDEDLIAVMAIPEGKKIIITATEGQQTRIVELPALVTISSQGMIAEKPLSGDLRQNLQQGTTPNAGTPEPGESGLPPTVDDILNQTETLTQESFTPTEDSTAVTETIQSEGEHFFTGP